MRFLLTTAAALALAVPFVTVVAASTTPADIIAAAPADAWADIAPEDLLVMTLEGGKRVVIQLAPFFSQAHVANMRTLARAHWWDGTAVYRVQDNYVAQWGDRTEKKPLPEGMPAKPPEDYARLRASAGKHVTAMPGRDSYAEGTGFYDGWPVAWNKDHVWMTHCYATVGVARDLAPDAGSGAELYAVIGHAPRQLDRNIALVGRVIEGIDALSSLPRGTEALGMYAPAQAPTPILSVRLASEIPEAERPRFQMMATASDSFRALAQVRANRNDDFFRTPAGGVDICNLPVPIRKRP